MAVLYVFIDVSGNYDFSNTGTKYLVLAGVICSNMEIKKYERIFIFIDREFSNAKDREPLIKGIKRYLSQQLSKIPYQILMHGSMSYMYLQIVDYCSWAIYRKWESKDIRPYEKIKGLARSEIFLYGGGEVADKKIDPPS